MTPYITIEEAQLYFDERLDTEAWDLASNTDRLKALKQATRAIDALPLIGFKTVTSQELEFPRTLPETRTSLGIPQAIKDACAEIAISLLSGVRPEIEFDNLRVTTQGFGQVRSTKTSESVPEHVVAGIASSTAWQYLKPYVRDSKQIEMSRVN